MKTHILFLALCGSVLVGCSRSAPPRASLRQSNDLPIAVNKNTPILDADRKAIFNALLHHLLTDPDLESSRRFYGTPGDRRFALVSNDGFGEPWPEGYLPSIDGFEAVRRLEGSRADRSQPRLVGIRLDKMHFDDQAKHGNSLLVNGQIEVVILNAGGSGGEAIHIGGCRVFYDAKRTDEKWIVEFKEAVDP